MHFHEDQTVSLFLDNLKIIEEIHSSFHHIVFYQHEKLGKVLVIDHEIMHIEKYQCFYHEPLVHLPFAIKHDIKTVLILGGGSLFAANEVLKYKSVDKIVLCDHDSNVLELMNKYYDHAQKVLADNRFFYVENDVIRFLQTNKLKFDLIINDCFDLSKVFLNNYNLYDELDNHLTQKGLCSDLIYDDIFNRNTMRTSLKYLQKKRSLFYSLVYVPEYPGVLHLQTIWSKGVHTLDTKRLNVDQLNISNVGGYEYYNPYYLNYYLYLPKIVRDIIE